MRSYVAPASTYEKITINGILEAPMSSFIEYRPAFSNSTKERNGRMANICEWLPIKSPIAPTVSMMKPIATGEGLAPILKRVLPPISAFYLFGIAEALWGSPINAAVALAFGTILLIMASYGIYRLRRRL